MPYTLLEERVNTGTHLMGALLIIFLSKPLLSLVPDSSDSASIWVFLTTFLFVFTASSIYHGARRAKLRRQLKILDHVAIYFFIAGSNTPYLLYISQNEWAIFFLVTMWLLVVLGTLFKVMGWALKPRISLGFYLFMGWLGLVTLILIYPIATPTTIRLVVLGGIFYTVGAYFYHHDYKPWYHSIWHGFVLLGAFSHYAALYFQLA